MPNSAPTSPAPCVAVIGGATAGAEVAGRLAERGAIVVVFEMNQRPYGKIEDGLYFQGGGRFFTLWNPAELAQMGDDWAGAKAACDSFLADAKAKSGKGGGK